MRNLITKRPWLVATSAMAVALMAVTFLAAISFAGQVQAQPNQDTGGMFVGEMFMLDSVENQGWTTITGLEGWYKTANDKELVIDVSLECGLYTDTLVASKGGKKETAVAESSVQVRVLIDGEYAAEPGIVTFCRRSQTLMATFQGLLEGEDENGDPIVCLSADPDTGDITIDEDCLRPEEVQLILDTTNANAFNFVAFDLAAGGEGHTIEVQSKISSNTDGTSDGGTASANAVIGKGSAIVYETRFAKTSP